MNDLDIDRATVTQEMPKYKCHKEVWALKIKSINVDPPMSQKENTESDGCYATIVPLDEGFGALRITKAYMKKHKPKEGGYYVVYRGGYKSFSPAEAFEGGYSKI